MGEEYFRSITFRLPSFLSALDSKLPSCGECRGLEMCLRVSSHSQRGEAG
jgi:hypothetical protein